MTTPDYVHMHDSDPAVAAWRWRIPLILAVWAAGVALASGFGLVAALPLPLVAALVALGIAAPVVAYAHIPTLQTFLGGRPLNDFTVFHLWRIGAAAAFFYYGAQEALPATFVRHAAWGDLLAGLLVLPVLLIPVRGYGKYVVFHAVGFADFVLAVGTGLWFSLADDPKMATIATFPLALVPLFGVGVSGASHLIAFDVIRRRRRRAALDAPGAGAAQ